MERAGDGDGAAKNGSEGSPPIGDTRPELKQPNSCTIQRGMIGRGIDTAAEQGDRGTDGRRRTRMKGGSKQRERTVCCLTVAAAAVDCRERQIINQSIC